MRYEINVSLNGRHYFATHPRSLRDGDSEDNAVTVAQNLRDRFPASEGYKVEMQEIIEYGRPVEF